MADGKDERSGIDAQDAGPARPIEDVDLDSVTLRRLLEEVRNEEPVEAHAYNRMHNRHNR